MPFSGSVSPNGAIFPYWLLSNAYPSFGAILRKKGTVMAKWDGSCKVLLEAPYCGIDIYRVDDNQRPLLKKGLLLVIDNDEVELLV